MYFITITQLSIIAIFAKKLLIVEHIVVKKIEKFDSVISRLIAFSFYYSSVTEYR